MECRVAHGTAASDEARDALNELIESYWYPLYAFSRRCGNSHHDALDLTQGFLAHLLQGEALRCVSPDKGRFRSFLLASFKNFMANQRRAAATLRRGGSVNTISLNDADFRTRYDREPAVNETPECCSSGAGWRSCWLACAHGWRMSISKPASGIV